MKRNLILLTVGLVVVLLAAAVYFDPTGVARGWLTREPFYQGRPVSYWRRALAGDDPAMQADTYRRLTADGRAAVPVLVALLGDEKTSGWDAAEVRWKAADLLGQLGPAAREATPALIAAATDDDAHVSKVAVTTLGLVVPADAAGEVIPTMIALLPRSGPAAAAAARAISKFGAAGEPAIPALLKAMHDPDSEVRWNAMRTLGKIGPAAKRAVPDLVAAMKDENPQVREHAAEALGDIGPEAKDAVPALIAVLKDPVARVRRDAVRSLGQIGPAAALAVPHIEPLVKDPDGTVRQAAAKAVRILTGGTEPKTP